MQFIECISRLTVYCYKAKYGPEDEAFLCLHHHVCPVIFIETFQTQGFSELLFIYRQFLKVLHLN